MNTKRFLVSLAVAGLLAVVFAPPSSAHDVGNAIWSYYTQSAAPPTNQYCAQAENHLWDDGSDFTYASGTHSKKGSLCDSYQTSYGVNASSHLIHWSMGTPSACGFGVTSQWQSQVAGTWIDVPGGVTSPPCGSGDYSNTTGHNVYITGTKRGAISSTGTHNF